MLLCSVSIAFIVFVFLICSNLFFTPPYPGKIATDCGPYCDGALTGFDMHNPMPPSQTSPFRILKKFILDIVIDHGSTIASVVAAILTLANIFIYKMRKHRALTKGFRYCSLEGLRRFSLDEILLATKNFNDASVIGRQRFGSVYRGLIDNGKHAVAIKRLSLYSLEGEPEFWIEVKALSKMRHANLVSLIGYCKESQEAFLVYEFEGQLELLLENHVVGGKNRGSNAPEASPSTRPNMRDASSKSTPSLSSLGLWSRKPTRRIGGLEFPDEPCHRFSISDINGATGNFRNNNIIINDGLYTIYKGIFYPERFYTIYDRRIAAIVRINHGKDGMPGISPELKMLSRLDHPNLAPMVGCCSTDRETIIVYEHDGHGTLLEHLDHFHLPWMCRLKICIAAAKALRYFHMGTGVKIIHGDISPTTILLDNDWDAKVVTCSSILIHLNARNAGELKRMPPDFTDPTELTEKSDVYLFGLLLLVVLCGKDAFYNYRSGRYPLLLPDAVSEAIEKQTLYRIADRFASIGMASDCLGEFVLVAFKCLRWEQTDRPSMDAVIKHLEEALHLQQNAEKSRQSTT